MSHPVLLQWITEDRRYNDMRVHPGRLAHEHNI